MLKFAIAFAFWLVWGAFENRAWKEHGDPWILGHFKTYHLVMFVFDVAMAYLGASSAREFLFLLLWAPLGLDACWWLIRYYDFKRDPEKAKESYGEPNAWHLRTDWDNWLGLPLVAGVYWWWWLIAGMLVVNGALIAWL